MRQRAVPCSTPKQEIEQQSNAIIHDFVSDRFNQEFGLLSPGWTEKINSWIATGFAAILKGTGIISASVEARVGEASSSIDDAMAPIRQRFKSLSLDIERTHGSEIRALAGDVFKIALSNGRSAWEAFSDLAASLLSDGVTFGSMVNVMLSGFELIRMAIRAGVECLSNAKSRLFNMLQNIFEKFINPWIAKHGGWMTALLGIGAAVAVGVGTPVVAGGLAAGTLAGGVFYAGTKMMNQNRRTE